MCPADFTDFAWERVGRNIGVNSLTAKKVFYVNKDAIAPVKDGATPETGFLTPQACHDSSLFGEGDGMIILTPTSGFYDMDSVNGFDITKNNIVIFLSPKCELINTNIGALAVVTIDGKSRIKWINGRINGGTAAGDKVGLKLLATSAVCEMNTFRNLTIYNCGDALQIGNSDNGTSFNEFFDCFFQACGGLVNLQGTSQMVKFINCVFFFATSVAKGWFVKLGATANLVSLTHFIRCTMIGAAGTNGIEMGANASSTLFDDVTYDPYAEISDLGSNNYPDFRPLVIMVPYTELPSANYVTEQTIIQASKTGQIPTTITQPANTTWKTISGVRIYIGNTAAGAELYFRIYQHRDFSNWELVFELQFKRGDINSDYVSPLLLSESTSPIGLSGDQISASEPLRFTLESSISESIVIGLSFLYGFFKKV